MNQLDASFAIMEKILNAQNMQMHLLDKKFFKLTLETFKQSFLKSDNMSQELMDKFLGLVEKIQTENQLNTFDLPDCAVEVRRLVNIYKQENRPKSTRTIPKSTQNNKTTPKNGNILEFTKNGNILEFILKLNNRTNIHTNTKKIFSNYLHLFLSHFQAFINYNLKTRFFIFKGLR